MAGSFIRVKERKLENNLRTSEVFARGGCRLVCVCGEPHKAMQGDQMATSVHPDPGAGDQEEGCSSLSAPGGQPTATSSQRWCLQWSSP